MEGSKREDDTATAGMPQGRSTPTPEGGLGNEPGHNHPEPSQGALASILSTQWHHPHRLRRLHNVPHI